jgi:hypothetical protein
MPAGPDPAFAPQTAACAAPGVTLQAAVPPCWGAPSIFARSPPDGQITESCPAPFAKIFSFAPDPNQFTESHRLVPQRGARAIVTDAGRDAVDTDSAARRPALEVDGEVVWS